MVQKNEDPTLATPGPRENDQAAGSIFPKTSTAKSRVQAFALSFAKLGHAVLLLHGIVKGRCTCGRADCDSPGKHPYARLVPHGKDDATTDPTAIESWFKRFPRLNYAIRTDALPTIDIDPRNGGDESWRELLGDRHDLDSWRVATGGGGDHIICHAPAGTVRSETLSPGVELQAAGKYIVGVGSRHISGKRYRWYAECSPDEIELCPLPPWIIKLAKADKWTPRDPDWYAHLVAPAMNGERHAKVASLLGHLFGAIHPNRGVLLQLVLSHVKHTYPDLTDFDDDEVMRIAQDLARREDHKRGSK